MLQTLTGLRLKACEGLLRDVLPRDEAAAAKRLQREPEGGRESTLAPLDPLLGDLLGVSDATVSHLIGRSVKT